MKTMTALLLATVSIAGCDQSPIGSVGKVVLEWHGELQTSYVHKIGPYCWVAWYSGIEQFLLKDNGVADDGSTFHYRWRLDAPGFPNPQRDHEWFAANCLEWTSP